MYVNANAGFHTPQMEVTASTTMSVQTMRAHVEQMVDV